MQAIDNVFQASLDGAKALEEHCKTCIAAPCARCDRHVCPCGTAFIPELNPPPEYDLNGRRILNGQQTTCLPCSEKRRRRLALEPLYLSIPKRFRWAVDATIDDLRQPDPDKGGAPRVELSADFIATALERASGDCRMIVGSTGSGKTSFVAAILFAWVRREWRARAGTRFVSAQWVAGARNRHALGQGEAPEVALAMSAPLIVLDDLGNDSPDHRNTIADILFKRHEDELPTWVTSGYPVSHLEGRYGAALIRRVVGNPKALIEMGKR